MRNVLIISSFIIWFTISLHAVENFYSLSAKKINGKTLQFKDLKGKKLLIVNTASKCSFTPQYAGLQKLYELYGGDNFEIIGFPANNFNGQELGTNDDIEDFCKENYGVTFTMMEKVSVSNYNYLSWPANPANSSPTTKHPVYQWLTEKSKNGVADTEILWNFYKFLINEDGTLYGIAPSNMSPLNDQIVKWITNTPPKITINPQSQEVVEGSSLTLSVTASGENLQYKWKKGNQYLQGQTSSTLTITKVTLNDAGTYICTVNNSVGSVDSEPAVITVKSIDKPILTLSSTEYNFGNTELNSKKEQKFETLIKNTGKSNLIINSITFAGTNANEFKLVGTNLPMTVTPNSFANVTISFNPATAGSKSATVKFTSNSEISPEFSLKGFSAVVKLSTDLSELNFIAEKINETTKKKVVLKNNGNVELDISQSIEGNDASSFSLESPSDIKINPDKEIELMINYIPKSNDNVSANLKLKIPEFNKEIDIILKGSVSATSVDTDENKSDFTVFPNPATDRIYFSTSKNKSDFVIAIFNIEGECIQKFKLSGQSIDLDVSKYPNGLYYFQFISNKGIIIESGKFLKVSE